MVRYVPTFVFADCLLIVLGAATHHPAVIFLGTLGAVAGCMSWLLLRAGARRGRR